MVGVDISRLQDGSLSWSSSCGAAVISVYVNCRFHQSFSDFGGSHVLARQVQVEQ